MVMENTCTIVFGPTQSGKSSFIKKLMPESAEDMPQVGRSGAGLSVTDECAIYDTEIGKVLDSPGYNDTNRDVMKQEFISQAATLAGRFRCSGVRFLLVDSMTNDSIRLRETSIILRETFGAEALASVVVLATKVDKLDEDEVDERLENMRTTLRDIGFEDCAIVTWTSKKRVSEDKMAEQTQELTNALERKQIAAIPMPEFSPGEHIVTEAGLHGIVVDAVFIGVEAKWKITVTLLEKNETGSAFKKILLPAGEIRERITGSDPSPEQLERSARRAEFLMTNTHLLSELPENCNSECFAVWCRLGEWKPTSLEGILSANHSWKAAMLASARILGAMGVTTTVPLAVAAFPIVVPLASGLSAVCYAHDCRENKKRVKLSERLNSEFRRRFEGAK